MKRKSSSRNENAEAAKHSEYVMVRFTPAQRDALEDRARQDYRKTSELIRLIVLKELGEPELMQD